MVPILLLSKKSCMSWRKESKGERRPCPLQNYSPTCEFWAGMLWKLNSHFTGERKKGAVWAIWCNQGNKVGLSVVTGWNMGLLELCEVKSKEKSQIANILEIFKLKCFKGQETGVRGVRDERLGTGRELFSPSMSPPLPFHNSATFRKNYHWLLLLCDSYPSFQPFMWMIHSCKL